MTNLQRFWFYLTSLRSGPSEIGLSKLWCRGCHVWLTTVINKTIKGGGVSTWTVSGTHGKNYPCARYSTSEAEESVLNDLHNQITKLIDSLQPLKSDANEESETRKTQRLHSRAADVVKRFLKK